MKIYTVFASFFCILFFVPAKAQQKSFEILSEEAEIIKREHGEHNLIYSFKLLELVKELQNQNKIEDARNLLMTAAGLLNYQNAKLTKIDSARTLQDSIEFNKQLNSYKSDYCLLWWLQMTFEEKPSIGQDFMTQSKWFNISIESNKHHNISQLLELSEKYYGGNSDIYLKNWQEAYNLYSKEATLSIEKSENLWQELLNNRKETFGDKSDEYISALFGMSHFYKRIKKNDEYQNLRTQVEKIWAAAYELPITYTSSNKKNKKNENKGNSESEFLAVEVMPRFPGCEAITEDADKRKCSDQKLLSFIYGHIKYPEIAQSSNIEGRAVVSFIVTEHGTIVDAEILQNPGGKTGEEALRVVTFMNELPSRWIAGKQSGEAVRVKFNLPVQFKLN